MSWIQWQILAIRATKLVKLECVLLACKVKPVLGRMEITKTQLIHIRLCFNVTVYYLIYNGFVLFSVCGDMSLMMCNGEE